MTEDLLNKIEALLFASGKFMTDENLSLIIGADIKEVRKSLKILKDTYDNGQNSLRLDQETNSWKINVKEKYLDLVRKIVADTELPKSVLETLAVIAYKSPALQSDIVKIRSNKAYEHIAQLEEMGFVIKDKSGRSFKLKVTEKFYEYFDVDNAKSLKEMFKDIKQPKKEEQITLQEPHAETQLTQGLEENTQTEHTESVSEPNQAPVAIPDQPIEEIQEAIEKDQEELKVLENKIADKPTKIEEHIEKKETFDHAKKQIEKVEKKEKIVEKEVKKKKEKKILRPVKKQEILKQKPMPKKIVNIKNVKKELKPVNKKVQSKNSKKPIKKKK